MLKIVAYYSSKISLEWNFLIVLADLLDIANFSWLHFQMVESGGCNFAAMLLDFRAIVERISYVLIDDHGGAVLALQKTEAHTGAILQVGVVNFTAAFHCFFTMRKNLAFSDLVLEGNETAR